MAGDEGVLRVTRSLAVPLGELAWRFSASGGPGGQHANTANTKVEVRFDLQGSPSLGPRQRARLMERYGSEVRVVVTAERSQARNRALALERLADRLRDGLRVAPPRVATAPTAGSARRRLEAKRRQALRKQARRAPSGDE